MIKKKCEYKGEEMENGEKGEISNVLGSTNIILEKGCEEKKMDNIYPCISGKRDRNVRLRNKFLSMEIIQSPP